MVTYPCDSTLLAFAIRFLARPFAEVLSPPPDAYDGADPDVDRYVLFREDIFQVELLLVRPGPKEFPEHLHPDIDTLQIHMSGDFVFTSEGEPMPYLVGPLGRFPVLFIPAETRHAAFV